MCWNRIGMHLSFVSSLPSLPYLFWAVQKLVYWRDLHAVYLDLTGTEGRKYRFVSVLVRRIETESRVCAVFEVALHFTSTYIL